MLLDLFIAAAHGRLVRIKSACIAAAVPPTTALRWLAIMEEEGIVEKYPDENDGRVTNVCLTTKGKDLVSAYLRNALDT